MLFTEGLSLNERMFSRSIADADSPHLVQKANAWLQMQLV